MNEVCQKTWHFNQTLKVIGGSSDRQTGSPRKSMNRGTKIYTYLLNSVHQCGKTDLLVVARNGAEKQAGTKLWGVFQCRLKGLDFSCCLLRPSRGFQQEWDWLGKCYCPIRWRYESEKDVAMMPPRFCSLDNLGRGRAGGTLGTLVEKDQRRHKKKAMAVDDTTSEECIVKSGG